jgi:hypothetical protein
MLLKERFTKMNGEQVGIKDIARIANKFFTLIHLNVKCPELKVLVYSDLLILIYRLKD